MNISIWTLAAHLKDFHPDPDIVDGTRIIQNARLSSRNINLSPSTVYLIPIDDSHIQCVNNDDLITLECSDIDVALNRILDVFEYYNDWQSNLQSLMRSELSANEMLMNLYNVFFHRMLLVDDSFFVYGSYDHTGCMDCIGQMLPESVIEALIHRPDCRAKTNFAYPLSLSEACPWGSTRAVAYSLFEEEEHAGWLIGLDSSEDFDDIHSQGELDLLSGIAEMTELWLFSNKGRNETRTITRFITQILDETSRDFQQLSHRLEAFGWQEDAPKKIFVFDMNENSKSNLFRVLHRLKELLPQAFVYLYGDRIVVLALEASLSVSSLRQLLYLLKKEKSIGGESNSFAHCEDLMRAYSQAVFAVENAVFGIKTFSELLLAYGISLLSSCRDCNLKNEALATLSTYDSKHEGELYETLRVFLENERNFTQTAAQLNIHRSTLIYRIDRITELCNLNLEDADTRLHLLLSYRL